MVDVKRSLENDFEKIVVSSEKTQVKYIISKAENGYSQYLVSLTRGSAPKELQGMFTTPDSALKAVKKYLASKRWTQAAKNNETAKRVEERKRKRNASKLQSNSSVPVQQGAAD